MTLSEKTSFAKLLQEKAHAGGGAIPKRLMVMVWSGRLATVIVGGRPSERVFVGSVEVSFASVEVAVNANPDTEVIRIDKHARSASGCSIQEVLFWNIEVGMIVRFVACLEMTLCLPQAQPNNEYSV
jgi:hypothetical protein